MLAPRHYAEAESLKNTKSLPPQPRAHIGLGALLSLACIAFKIDRGVAETFF